MRCRNVQDAFGYRCDLDTGHADEHVHRMGLLKKDGIATWATEEGHDLAARQFRLHRDLCGVHIQRTTDKPSRDGYDGMDRIDRGEDIPLIEKEVTVDLVRRLANDAQHAEYPEGDPQSVRDARAFLSELS